MEMLDEGSPFGKIETIGGFLSVHSISELYYVTNGLKKVRYPIKYIYPRN